MADKVSSDELFNRLKDAVAHAEEWEDPITLTLDVEDAEAVETIATKLGLGECDPW